jgi:hypothetical protein
LSVDDPLLIEHEAVPVTLKSMADDAPAALRFAPPPDFAAAGFEAFTVNIEARLTLRCLTLPDSARVLESLRLVAQRWPQGSSGPAAIPHRLRAVLLRSDKGGRLQVVRVSGQSDHLLEALCWDATQWDAKLNPVAINTSEQRGSSAPGMAHSGEDGLARVWQEIRTWIHWCDLDPTPNAADHSSGRAANLPTPLRCSFQEYLRQAAEAKARLSLTRRADMEKWVAGAREWEQPADGSSLVQG